jgi:predicted O-methyltransferase YrrM
VSDLDVRKLLRDFSGFPDKASQAVVKNARSISMLSEEVLGRLFLLASQTPGPILEVGPYIGGSTTAFCGGARLSGARIVSIEAGGSQEHPTLPSSDILLDLRGNLRRWNNETMVTVIEGFGQDRTVRYRARKALGSEPVQLLFVDADGDVATILFLYRRLLADEALLVLDDYAAEAAPDKQALVRPFVDDMVRQGALGEYGVFKFGTWFGRLNGLAGKAVLDRVSQPFAHEHGYCYTYSSIFPVAASAMGLEQRSGVVLLEDGRPLGPGNSLHDEIRSVGGGRFSHWISSNPATPDDVVESTLYFSASDNSDPNENGRRYSIRVAGVETALVDV